MSQNLDLKEHNYFNDICQTCGVSRKAAESFGWSCKPFNTKQKSETPNQVKKEPKATIDNRPIHDRILSYVYQGLSADQVISIFKNEGVEFNEYDVRKHFKQSSSEAKWVMPLFFIIITVCIGIIKTCTGD